MQSVPKPELSLDPRNAPATLSPAFAPIEALVASFHLADFNDPARAQAYADALDLWPCLVMPEGNPQSTDPLAEVRDGVQKAHPLGPVLGDLCRLHWLTLRRRSVSVLEFGSGFSTVVLAHAMRLLHGHFHGWAQKNLRTEQPFHVHSVEEEQRFQALTQQRLGDALTPFATVTRSSVELITHDNRFATIYSSLPNIAPDLIYLDGPSQFATTAALNGFSIASPVRMPMSADILRMEFFLEPGCVLLIDGRTQNARFLKSYFRRAWAHHHDRAGDIHLFELQEDPLGPINQRKLDFSLGQGWLL